MRAAVGAARLQGKPVDPQGAWSKKSFGAAGAGQEGVEMTSTLDSRMRVKVEGKVSSQDAEDPVAAAKTPDKFGTLHEMLLSKKY